MNEKDKNNISKFLSLVLRHSPDSIGLQLDENGWADIEELIKKSDSNGISFNLEDLNNIVNTSDKKRFAISESKTKIRANQGHSISSIDLKLEAMNPPEILYHGTVEKFIDSIKKVGLQKRSRQHVHLSKDIETATKVATRRGLPIILKIKAAHMQQAGFDFFCSENGVWLTKNVPVEFIEFKSL